MSVLLGQTSLLATTVHLHITYLHCVIHTHVVVIQWTRRLQAFHMLFLIRTLNTDSAVSRKKLLGVSINMQTEWWYAWNDPLSEMEVYMGVSPGLSHSHINQLQRDSVRARWVDPLRWRKQTLWCLPEQISPLQSLKYHIWTTWNTVFQHSQWLTFNNLFNVCWSTITGVHYEYLTVKSSQREFNSVY